VRYFYLLLNSEYVVLVAGDSDRVGLVGASFSAEHRAAEYVERLNNDEADKSEVSS
jgi:hypothetical protein